MFTGESAEWETFIGKLDSSVEAVLENRQTWPEAKSALLAEFPGLFARLLRANDQIGKTCGMRLRDSDVATMSFEELRQTLEFLQATLWNTVPREVAQELVRRRADYIDAKMRYPRPISDAERGLLHIELDRRRKNKKRQSLPGHFRFATFPKGTPNENQRRLFVELIDDQELAYIGFHGVLCELFAWAKSGLSDTFANTDDADFFPESPTDQEIDDRYRIKEILLSPSQEQVAFELETLLDPVGHFEEHGGLYAIATQWNHWSWGLPDLVLDWFPSDEW